VAQQYREKKIKKIRNELKHIIHKRTEY
jgi:hypothetical protein